MGERSIAGARTGDLLISGHVNVDHFLALDRFPGPDRTVPIVAERKLLGGTAANLARVAIHYGVRSGLVARIGDDFPAAFLAALRRERIDLSGVESVPRTPTPTCYIVVDRHHEQRTLIEQGPMDAPPVAPPARGAPWRRFSWLHVTTGSPDWQLALAERARAAGAFVAADPAQEIHYRWDGRRLRALLRRSEILFGNHHEIARARALLGLRSTEALLDTVPIVIETAGARGARAHTRAGPIAAPAPRARRIVSLIGSGDAFRGGFYAAWFEGEPLAGCLRAGARAATAWIEGRSVPRIELPLRAEGGRR